MPNLRDAQRSEADPFARAQMWYAVAAWYDHRANRPGVARQDANDYRQIASALRQQAVIGLKTGVLRAVAERADRENLSGARRAEFGARHANAAKRLGNQRSKVKTKVGQLIDEGFGQQTPVLSNMPGNVGRAAYNRFIDATYADFTGSDGPDIADAWSRLTRDLNLAGERAVRTMVLGDRSRRTRQQQRQTGRAAEPPSTAPAPGVVEKVMHSVAVAGALRARAEASAPASEDENTPYPREQLLGQARILELYAQQTLRREGLRAGENLTRSIVEDHARGYISGQRVSAREADRQRAAFQTSVAEHYRREEQELDTPEARTVSRRAAEILNDFGVAPDKLAPADERAVAAFAWMAEADARERAAQITNTKQPVRARETKAASAEFAGETRAYAERHREAYAERAGRPVDGMNTRSTDYTVERVSPGARIDEVVDAEIVEDTADTGSGDSGSGSAQEGKAARSQTAGFGPVRGNPADRVAGNRGRETAADGPGAAQRGAGAKQGRSTASDGGRQGADTSSVRPPQAGDAAQHTTSARDNGGAQSGSHKVRDDTARDRD